MIEQDRPEHRTSSLLASVPVEDLTAIERHILTRQTLPKHAGVEIFAFQPRDQADSVEPKTKAIAQMLKQRGRSVAVTPICLSSDGPGLAEQVQAALDNGDLPLVLFQASREPWQAKHLFPLLDAIDHADHVLGQRQDSWTTRLKRRVRWLGWSWYFALPGSDPLTPCQLHRRDALSRLCLQSRSEFLRIELLAKATYLKHIVIEASVPPLAGAPIAISGKDVAEVRKTPRFPQAEAVS